MTTTQDAPPPTPAASPPAGTKAQSSRSKFRVKVPTVLQMEATECGAASLGMVLGRYGRVETLDDLRVLSGVSRDGATANNILRAARSLGMTAKAYKREPEQLKSMTFPLIIHWRFYHYVVVEGWYPGGWYLNDPASGPRQCDHREFDESFTGVTISLVPGPEFEPGGKRAGIVGRLLAAAGHVRPAIIAVLLAALLLLVPTLLVPQVLKVYGNQLAGIGSSVAIATAVGLLLALLVQTVLLSLQGSISVRTSTKITVRLGATMVQRLLQLPTAFHAQRGAAAIAQRAVLLDTLSEAVSSLVLTMTTGLFTAVAAAVVLLLIDPLIGLLAVAVSVIMGVVLHYSVRRARDEASKVVVEQVETGRVFASALSQIESIKASGAEDGVIARGIAAENRLLEANQRIGVRMLGLNLLPAFMGGLSVVIIAGVSMLGIIGGRLEQGQLLAILALTGVLIAPMAQIVMVLGQTQLLRATLDQVDDVLKADIDSEWDPSADTPAPGSIRGELEGIGLTFGYSPTGPPVITDVSLRIEPGRRVALVGPSGCGKSTLSKLVLGLYQPWSGEIRIDGLLRSQHAPEVLTDALALVDQDVSIFAGTFRENITLWDTTIPETDILQAVADAQLSDDIARRPGGLDAVLLEGGKDLSGGQRQRLEIARALVRRPRLLVMDEATSALDPTTEKAIDEAIRRRGITCLVIAHRLSTIRDSDEIIVLERGSVVERGTHEQLIARDGEYARLVASG